MTMLNKRKIKESPVAWFREIQQQTQSFQLYAAYKYFYFIYRTKKLQGPKGQNTFCAAES